VLNLTSIEMYFKVFLLLASLGISESRVNITLHASFLEDSVFRMREALEELKLSHQLTCCTARRSLIEKDFNALTSLDLIIEDYISNAHKPYEKMQKKLKPVL
jgi:hypothetical protein